MTFSYLTPHLALVPVQGLKPALPVLRGWGQSLGDLGEWEEILSLGGWVDTPNQGEREVVPDLGEWEVPPDFDPKANFAPMQDSNPVQRNDSNMESNANPVFNPAVEILPS